MTVVDGLSFGVLKEQEFKFKSKLTHQVLQRSRANSLPHHAQVPLAVNGFVPMYGTVPACPVASNGNGVELHNVSSVQQMHLQQQKLDKNDVIQRTRMPHRRGQIPFPVVDYGHTEKSFTNVSAGLNTITEEEHHDRNGYDGNVSNLQTNNPFDYKEVPHGIKRNSESDGLTQLAYQAGQYPSLRESRKVSRHYSFSSGQKPNINRQTPLQDQHQQQQNHEANMAKFAKHHAAQFTSGDPHSDKLAEFVSKMVFYIFWYGSDSYDYLMMHGKLPSTMPLSNQHRASDDFIYYTKYLLETMQVSCSTALLSLFYLHRLKPRVEHLFVPGTFTSDNCANSKRQQPKGERAYEGRQSQQYRRDSKLEYRLFTVALILANKYLDDNSYSNKVYCLSCSI
jgi:hypothetical protein